MSDAKRRLLLAMVPIAVACHPPSGAPSPDRTTRDGFVTRPSVGTPTPPAAGIAVPSIGRRAWREGTGCGIACPVRVWIGAYGNEHLEGPAHPSSTPHLIARLINTGTRNTANYELMPGKDTHYDLYILDTLGVHTWELVPVNRAADTRKALHGTVVSCNHPLKDLDDADFSDCNYVHSYDVWNSSVSFNNNLRATALIAFLTAADVMMESPAWFACDGGCCTASYSSMYRA